MDLDNDPTIPLLRATRAARAAPVSPPPFKLSAPQEFAIYFFCVTRLVRALLLVAWPALGLASFEIPATGPAFMMASLLASRDLVLGALLWTADRGSRRETSRALLFNLLVDSMDTFILIFSAACDWHEKRSPLAEIVTVAVLAILEHLTLYSMSEDDCPDAGGQHGGNVYVAYGGAANYAYGLQVSEDKQRRVDAWLTELRAAEDQMPPQQYRPASTIVAESNVPRRAVHPAHEPGPRVAVLGGRGIDGGAVHARPLAPHRRPRAQPPVQQLDVGDPALDVPVLAPVPPRELDPPVQDLPVVAGAVDDEAEPLLQDGLGQRPVQAVGRLGGVLEGNFIAREERGPDDVVVQHHRAGGVSQQLGHGGLAGSRGA
ncbi:unnamed protein product [Clonostachys solani]|uniref:Uncharacterized protein n=1 Tax=Clonostachys solani TaxID=160281 RepID=A0A9P0EKL1_9HYPO|nr:unnamed protein product [Clonostachys solani]